MQCKSHKAQRNSRCRHRGKSSRLKRKATEVKNPSLPCMCMETTHCACLVITNFWKGLFPYQLFKKPLSLVLCDVPGAGNVAQDIKGDQCRCADK